MLCSLKEFINFLLHKINKLSSVIYFVGKWGSKLKIKNVFGGCLFVFFEGIFCEVFSKHFGNSSLDCLFFFHIFIA